MILYTSMHNAVYQNWACALHVGIACSAKPRAGSCEEGDSKGKILLRYLYVAQHQPAQAKGSILNLIHAQGKKSLSSDYSGASTGVAVMETSLENNPGDFKEVANGSEFWMWTDGLRSLKALSSITKTQTYRGHKKGKMLQLSGIYWTDPFVLGVQYMLSKNASFPPSIVVQFLLGAAFFGFTVPRFGIHWLYLGFRGVVFLEWTFTGWGIFGGSLKMFSLYSCSLGADVKQMENRYEKGKADRSRSLDIRIYMSLKLQNENLDILHWIL